MKTNVIVAIIGVISAVSIILGLTFTSLTDPNTDTDYESPFEDEHYKIEIMGIKDTYSAGESYSFSYVLSGFGNPCGSKDVTYPVNGSENITMSSRGLCAESTPKKFVWDIQKERGTTFGHANLPPGKYFVTVEFEKNEIFVSETKSFTVNSLDDSKSPENEIEPLSDKMRVTPESIPNSIPMIMTISIPEGTGIPGCEKNNKCFSPYEATIPVGTTIIWSNDDSATHNIISGFLSNVHIGSTSTSNSDDIATHNATSGIHADGPDGLFNSSLLSAGKTFEFMFVEAGSYDYFCMVHPWMAGIIHVV